MCIRDSYGIDHDLLGGVVVIPENQTTVTKTFHILIPSTEGVKSLGVRLVSVLKKNFVLSNKSFSFKRFFADQLTLVSAFSAPLNSYCFILKSSGVLKCWGTNKNGQLGSGNTVNLEFPTVIDAGTAYAKVSLSYTSGGEFGCGVTALGKLKCWGDNTYYQLGDGTTTASLVPKDIDAATGYADVCTGGSHGCGITTLGDLKCWGNNSSGQVGKGFAGSQTTPIVIDSGTKYSSVSCGNIINCGITTASDLKCWGENSNNFLGVSTGGDALSPTVIDAGVKYSKVSAGWTAICGITDQGDAKCWGSNSSGEVGIGSLSVTYAPTMISSSEKFKDISAKGNSTISESCGITNSQKLYCWGRGNVTPQLKGEGVDFQSIKLGENSRCTIANQGALSGVLRCDLETVKSVLSPKQLLTNETVEKMNLGHGDRFCRINNKKLICNLEAAGASAITFDQSSNYTAVSSSGGTICALTEQNKIKCFGSNSSGGIGDGTIVNKAEPVLIDVSTSYKFISVGDDHTCAITMNNKLKCWGVNSAGQIGDGTTTQRLVPVDVDSMNDYLTVSAGVKYTCAITIANRLKCWGDNTFGQLGDNTTTQRLVPTNVNSVLTFKSVSAARAPNNGLSSQTHTCAISQADDLYCWGDNTYYQLGDGTNVQSLSPLVIDSGTKYSKVLTSAKRLFFSTSYSDAYSCGLTLTGQIKCWGENIKGQLGMGDFLSKTLPTSINSVSTYKDFSVGGFMVCAQRSDNLLQCWGRVLETYFMKDFQNIF